MVKMMRKMVEVKRFVGRVLGVLGVAAAIGAMMACDDDSGNGGDGNNDGGADAAVISVSNAQVYNIDGTKYTGSGTVNLVDLDESGNIHPLDPIGTLQAGALTFTLPASMPAEALRNLGNLPSGITVTPQDVKVSSTALTLSSSNGDLVGVFLWGSWMADYRTISPSRSYQYCSKACSITGDSQNGSLTYSVYAQKGWNTILTILPVSGGGTGTVTTDLSKAPSGIKWYFYPTNAVDDTAARKALGRVFGE